MLKEYTSCNGTVLKDYRAFNDKKLDAVIYVPECDIHKYYMTKEGGYTYRKMLEIAKEYGINDEILFEMLDWQYPETLANEIAETEEEWGRRLKK